MYHQTFHPRTPAGATGAPGRMVFDFDDVSIHAISGWVTAPCRTATRSGGFQSRTRGCDLYDELTSHEYGWFQSTLRVRLLMLSIVLVGICCSRNLRVRRSVASEAGIPIFNHASCGCDRNGNIYFLEDN